MINELGIRYSRARPSRAFIRSLILLSIIALPASAILFAITHTPAAVDPLVWGEPVLSTPRFLEGTVSKVGIRIPYRNTGRAPIKVLGLRASCNCTGVMVPDALAPSSDEQHLEGTMNIARCDSSLKVAMTLAYEVDSMPVSKTFSGRMSL